MLQSFLGFLKEQRAHTTSSSKPTKSASLTCATVLVSCYGSCQERIEVERYLTLTVAVVEAKHVASRGDEDR